MERQIEKIVISRLGKWRSVALLGSRQVSKSYLYPGERIEKITKKVFAVPDWWLLGCY